MVAGKGFFRYTECEVSITSEKGIESIVKDIYDTVLND